MKTKLMKNQQTGAAAIEFALVASVFFVQLIGIMEMGRVMFYWNTATELTRMGARMAVVCDPGDASLVQNKIANFYPLIPQDKVQVDYLPNGCTVDNCQDVTVRVSAGVPVVTMIPFIPLNLSLPEFKTTLPRESLRSQVNSVNNPVCE